MSIYKKQEIDKQELELETKRELFVLGYALALFTCALLVISLFS